MSASPRHTDGRAPHPLLCDLSKSQTILFCCLARAKAAGQQAAKSTQPPATRPFVID